MRTLICCFLGLLMAAAAAAAETPAAAAANDDWAGKAVVIPLKGTIAPGKLGGSAEDFINAVKRAARAKIIIVEIDSPGGVVDSCDAICDALIHSPAPTTAVVLRQAVSGGAMVATACNKIYMVKGSRIGDIQPMNMLSSSGMDERTAEKIEADVRAIMAANANRNGYPKLLLEAMVSRSFEVYEVKFSDGSREYFTAAGFALLKENMAGKIEHRTFAAPPRIVSHKNKLLEVDAADAAALGIAAKVLPNRDAVFSELRLDPAEAVTAAVAPGELNPMKLLDGIRLSNWVVLALAVSLLIGVAGTLTEYHAPGFGIPGACGLIGFACFFYLLFSHQRAEWYEILIFITGIILLVLEIVVLPGFGICGGLGALCILTGIVLAVLPDLSGEYMQTNLWAETRFALLLGLGVLVGGGILFVAALGKGSRFPFGKQTFLEDVLPDYTAAVQNAETSAPAPENNSQPLPEERFLCARGVALTDLRPAGKVKLDSGEILDAVTAGEFGEKDRRVEVAAAAEGHIVVKILDERK